MNFLKSNLPIVKPLPFFNNPDFFEGCIINEFALEEIKPLVLHLRNIAKHLFKDLGDISAEDFFAFFTKFSNTNYSNLHADESHITVSICLEISKNYNEQEDEIRIENDSGQFLFWIDGKELEVKQIPNHALIFRGDIPHKTNPIIDGTRYNLNFYLKQNIQDLITENFYNKLYVEYLSFMGIETCDDTNSNIKKDFNFEVPKLPKIKVNKCKIKLILNGKHISQNLLDFVLQYLDKISLNNLEIVNSNFKLLCNSFYKKNYLKIIFSNPKNTEDENIREKIKNKIEDLEKIRKLNYKQLLESKSNSDSCCDSSKNVCTIFLDNMNLGNSYIDYINKIYGVRSNYLMYPTKDVKYQFRETIAGIFYPNSIILNIPSYEDVEFKPNISNFASQNYFQKNNEMNYLSFNNIENIDTEIIFEKIRKESEQSSSSLDFFITLNNEPTYYFLSTGLNEFIKDNFPKNKIITAPIFEEKYKNFSPLIFKAWQETGFILQYEKEIIEEKAFNQLNLFYNGHPGMQKSILFKNYSNVIVSRAIQGILMNMSESYDLIPYPTISLVQHIFSNSLFEFNSKFDYYEKNNQDDDHIYKSSIENSFFSNEILNSKSTFEVMKESIFECNMHKRNVDNVIYMALFSQFFGDVLPKDIMACVGALKTNRKINFVDWGTAGFKCNSHNNQEKIFDVSIIRSCHTLSNSSDSMDFFQKMCFTFENEKLKNSYQDLTDYVDLKEFIFARTEDYNECYAPNLDEI